MATKSSSKDKTKVHPYVVDAKNIDEQLGRKYQWETAKIIRENGTIKIIRKLSDE